jgi:hypothetical protein
MLYSAFQHHVSIVIRLKMLSDLRAEEDGNAYMEIVLIQQMVKMGTAECQ